MARDPTDVVTHDEEHLRRFLAARAAGDARAMRQWWDELVIDFHDRMDGLVALAHRGRLNAEEHELAVQLSLTRFSARLIHTFEGVSMGQLVNACKTLARGICMDVQRTSIRARGDVARSLDSGWDDDTSGRDAWELEEADRRLTDEQLAADLREFFAWALPQVPENQRRVVELTQFGASLPEIAAELDISEENAYQRRSRGYAVLRRLKEQWDT